MKITFKGKIKQGPAYKYIDIPQLTSKHCDMNAARVHPKLGDFANSTLFIPMLNRTVYAKLRCGMIRLDRIPEGVTIDSSGFLAVVSFEA